VYPADREIRGTGRIGTVDENWVITSLPVVVALEIAGARAAADPKGLTAADC
jgi:hypothetical protein